MSALKAIKDAALRQGPIFRQHQILLLMQITPDGIMIRASKNDATGTVFESSRKIAWKELEQSRDPGVFLNDCIDREIRTFEKAEKELHGTDDGKPVDEVRPYGTSPDVPIYDRNECCSGAGDN